MASIDIILEIIFSIGLVSAQITLIIVHILNNKKNRELMNKSREITKNSRQNFGRRLLKHPDLQ